MFNYDDEVLFVGPGVTEELEAVESFMKNCYIETREGDINIIQGKYEGVDGLSDVRVQLDGYAIIPIEIYNKLKE